jgi:MFS transporter, DHA1 family, multidrug resistance protein
MLRAAFAQSSARTRSGPGLFLVLGSVTVIGPASMDIYLPGLPALARDLEASPSAAQLTVATFLVGLGLGQLISGPLSDVYGRRRPLVAGIAVFTIASALCALAPNLVTLAAIRFVEGAAAASGMTLGRAIVRDLHAGTAAARYLSRLLLITGLGPILAPILGGQILRFTSWRGTFVALALLGTLLAFASLRLLPETLPPAQRHKGLGRQTASFALPLLRDRSFVGLVLVAALSGGAMISWVTGSSFLLEKVYGASPQLYGLLFGATAVVLVAGAQLNARLLRTHSPRTLLSLGLATMLAAATSLSVVVSFREAGLPAVMPPLALLAASWGLIQPNAFALALTPYPKMAGTASALVGVAQFTAGALLAPLVGIRGDRSAVSLVIVIGVCSLASALALRNLVPSSRKGDSTAAVEVLSAAP